MGERADSLQVYVDKAIGEWAAANGGGIANGYVMLLDYIDEDGDKSWATCYTDHQSDVQTLGLLRWHTLMVERDIERGYDRGNGDDL